MTNSENHPPTPVAVARERLEKALDELDSTLESRAENAAQETDSQNAITDENARLRKTNETVSKRLDAAIGRLRAVLEG